MSKILFLTTSHLFDDDRIFYHQAKELLNDGHQVMICSQCAEYHGIIDGIEIESFSILEKPVQEKLAAFKKVCENFNPDSIICSEPLAVIAAKTFSRKKKISVIYDITEWYPSMRMVAKHRFPLKWIHALKFFLIQLYAGFLSDCFIFGEESKKFPLAYFFPFKKKLLLPYFPDERYIFTNIKKLNPDSIKLCYTGQFSEEKGIGNFFSAAAKLREKKPNLHISLLLIGGARKKEDEAYFKELLAKYAWENISIEKPTDFESFSQSYADADICFDLREINFENHRCLPIKIFYYAASGKPVIYSDLKATRSFVEAEKFGYFVNPENAEQIAELILKYVENPDLYRQHAENGRRLYEEKYRWKIINSDFVDFVNSSVR